MHSINQLQRVLQIHRNAARLKNKEFLDKFSIANKGPIQKAIVEPSYTFLSGILEQNTWENELQEVLNRLDRLVDKYPDSENQVYLELYAYLSVRMSQAFKTSETTTTVEKLHLEYLREVVAFCLLETTNSRVNR